jgi:hypothetical protein
MRALDELLDVIRSTIYIKLIGISVSISFFADIQ